MSRHRFRALAALAVLAAAGNASAQRTSYDLERLQLDPTATGSLVLGTGELLPEDGYRLSLAAHWERAPLVLEKDGDLRGRGLLSQRSRDRNVVTDRFTGHLGIGLAVTSRVEFGLRIPYVIDQSGDDISAVGYPKLRSDTIGMPTAMLRVGLHKQGAGGMPVSVAVAVEAGLPFYHPDDVDGGHGDVITPRVEVGRSFGSYLVAGDLGLAYRTRHIDLPNDEKLGHEIQAGVVAATTGRPLRLEASLRGAFNFDGVSQSMELLLGARYQLCKYAEAFAIAGPGFMEAPGTPTVRALLGIAIGGFEGKAAPAAPPPPPPPVAAAPAPVDPCAPGHKHTPEQCPNNDDDGDGVPNKDDKCPQEKGPASNHGCPVDPCAPGQKHTPEQCPNNDDDGDGVLNKDDKCPEQPGVPENHGCPPQRAEIKVDKATGQAKIEIKEKVYFDVNKATIQSRSNALLDDVAKLMAANPSVKKVVVEGHTDNTGAADYNRKLSKDRAESVKKYLEGKGIAANRLEAKGIGPDRPAQPNTTAKGREANRRVEFIIEK